MKIAAGSSFHFVHWHESFLCALSILGGYRQVPGSIDISWSIRQYVFSILRDDYLPVGKYTQNLIERQINIRLSVSQ
jgi:hypothetical protein